MKKIIIKIIRKYGRYLLIGILIIISLVIFCFIPHIIDFTVFKNDAPSNLDNGEWAGFLGSYIGSLIGGIFTLIAVIISFRISNNNQTKSEIKENSTIVYYDFILGFLDLKKCYIHYSANYSKNPVRMYFSKDWIINVAKVHGNIKDTEFMYKIYGCLSEMAELLEEKVNFEIKNQGIIANEKCKKITLSTSEYIFSKRFLQSDKVHYNDENIIELDIENDLNDDIKCILEKLKMNMQD